MKKLFLIICLVNLFGSVFAQGKNEKEFISLWEGNLKINAISLKIVIKLFRNEDQSLGAFLDSPDQGVKNIPATFAKLTDDSLVVKIASIGGMFSGLIDKQTKVVNGIWKQGQLEANLSLQNVEKLSEVNRPQTPKKPYPYNEEEVVFLNREDNITLAGSFTYPKSGSNFPAVVLVTGSGRQDRDETLFEHKPFLVLADYLTRNGIAVLRYDDRGVGKSKGNFSSSTSEDFARDAIAAIEYLKTRKEVNSNYIGIIGHSEGGLIAPMAANISNDIKFIVMIAGPAVNGRDLLLLQEELILKASGITDEAKILQQVESSKKSYDIVINEPDSAKAYQKLKELYDEELKKLSEEERKSPEYSLANFERGAQQILSKWFRFFIKYDPRSALENINIPVLALNGSKDIQVSSQQNLPVIEEALKSAGNKNYQIVELEGLNHMLQHSETGAVTEYGKIEETMSEDALKIIANWINKISK